MEALGGRGDDDTGMSVTSYVRDACCCYYCSKNKYGSSPVRGCFQAFNRTGRQTDNNRFETHHNYTSIGT